MRTLKTYLESCADVFNETPKYAIPDQILTEQFQAHPRNDSLKEVFLKVALLNTLYGTQIFDVSRMAQHALGQGLDTLLGEGSPEAVAMLRRGHGFFTKRRTERDFYSFATKYCHWHRPDVYPMYDRYVVLALETLNSKMRFLPRLSGEQLRDYSQFLRAVDACSSSLMLDWPGYKRLDQALWVFGQIIEGKADPSVKRVVGDIPAA